MTEGEEEIVTQEDVRKKFVAVNLKMKKLRAVIRMAESVTQQAIAQYGTTGADYPMLYAALGELEELLP